MDDGSSAERARDWQQEYRKQIGDLLRRILHYLENAGREDVRQHLRSFLAALDEARRFPEYLHPCLALIHALHPLPLRWGYGRQWERQMRFALQNETDSARRADYGCDLAEFHLNSGEITQAIDDVQATRAQPAHPGQRARAGRILFDCYRSSGRHDQADAALQEMGARLGFPCPADQVEEERVAAWLEFSRCQLVLLREQGRGAQALDLVDEMIRLDERQPVDGGLQSAALLEQRSTLLWASGRYEQSVADLQRAIQLYENAGDAYNAESLWSNLGLVYWTMGELDRAQAALERVILFLQRCGAQRQMTADLGNLGLVYLSRGDLARAEEWMLRHIEHARLTGFLPEVYRGNTNLAAVSFYQGDYARALEMYTVNSAYFEQRGSREGFELDRLWIACCHSHLGDREGPPAAARAVLSQAREIHSEVLETLALRCLASFLPCRERLPYLLESYALSSRLGRMFEQAAALLALAEAETGEMGAGYWEQGAALLRRIGATAWLEGRTRENPPFLPMFV